METEAHIESERGPERGAPRDSLLLMTVFTSPQGLSLGQARVRNLSATGLMAETDSHIARGQGLTMEIRGVGVVQGRAAWARDGRVGIVFDHPIDPQQARRPVGQAPRTAVPQYLRGTLAPRRR
ncbi:MAG: pilus assembly protein PilZ [Sphingobium sp.]|jgi:hypothetical protein|nr:MAG: pilus assembly protein PilZ [Sphingobium sp.]